MERFNERHRNGNGNREKRRRRIIFGSVALLVLIGGGYGVYAALRPNHEIDPSKLTTVETRRSGQSSGRHRQDPAAFEGRSKSKASGIVKKLYVDYGDHVKQGQILAELDKVQLEASVRAAEGQLSGRASRARFRRCVARTQQGRRRRAGCSVPQLNMGRAEQMYKDGVMAKSLVEDAEKNYQMALNKQVSAQRTLIVAKAEIAKAEAEVAQAKAALENAEEDLRNSTIVSPIDGLVLSRDVNVGDAVSSILVLGSQATLLFTLGDISEVYVQGKVDEADIGKVYLNQPARIVVESFKDKKYHGQGDQDFPPGQRKGQCHYLRGSRLDLATRPAS